MSDPWSGAEDAPEPAGGDARRAGRRAGSRRGRGGSRPGFGDGAVGRGGGRSSGRRAGGAPGAGPDGAAEDATDARSPASADDRDPAEVARGICLRALTGASKTRQQLAELLARREIPADVAEAVLDRYTEVGLIDDAAFAAAWVTSRQSGRGLARRALTHELRAKGVDQEVAAAAVAEIDPQEEWDTARQLVARKVRSMARLDRVTAERRLVGMLARKGYGGGLAGIVVREALDALAAEEADEPDVGPDDRGAGGVGIGPDGQGVDDEPDVGPDGQGAGGAGAERGQAEEGSIAGFGRGLARRGASPRPPGMADEVGEGHWVGIGRFRGPDNRLG
jgi:SOS response regulatory protein OraA/RecX